MAWGGGGAQGADPTALTLKPALPLTVGFSE